MTRFFTGAAALLAAVSLATIAAHAQTAPAKPKSPKEIAAASEALAEKYDTCRREAKEQKLSYIKQKLYVHNCVRK